MKKKFYVTAIILLLTLTVCFSVGCSLFADNTPNRYYIDIGEVEDSRVASIVANNTIDSCVRITTEYTNGMTSKSSGFFVTSDGYIITNRHCVVRFTNGTDLPSSENEIPIGVKKYTVTDTKSISYKAKLVSYSKTADIALLKIDSAENIIDSFTISTTNFAPVMFDTVSKPYYGDRLYTIGNPEDMGVIFSELMVASPAIKLTSDDTYYSIVLDGNINHGNSGGALIDVNSHVVGLIFARVEGPTESSSKTYGLGCAIPADIVAAFLDANEINYSQYTPTTSEA
ncbi:MAG: serine protease [Clostridia bacterium]|nr:serine protease [Clostridia bacterium]